MAVSSQQALLQKSCIVLLILCLDQNIEFIVANFIRPVDTVYVHVFSQHMLVVVTF